MKRFALLLSFVLMASTPGWPAAEPASSSPAEPGTPWHVPVPRTGPEVGVVFPDMSGHKQDGHLWYQVLFTLPAALAQAGYRPTFLLCPAAAADPRAQRALKLCEYDGRSLILDEQTDLSRFALVTGPSATYFPSPAGAAALLERYVREGGRLLQFGTPVFLNADWLRLLGLNSNRRGNAWLSYETGDPHPLLDGLSLPLQSMHETPPWRSTI